MRPPPDAGEKPAREHRRHPRHELSVPTAVHDRRTDDRPPGASRPMSVEDDRLGLLLGAPIHVVGGQLRKRNEFVRGLVVVPSSSVNRCAAHVHEPGAGPARRRDDIPGPFHVSAPVLLPVATRADGRRRVEHGIARFGGRLQRNDVVQTAVDEFGTDPFEPSSSFARPHQGPHGPTVFSQSLGDVRAEHPRSTRDQRPAGHRITSGARVLGRAYAIMWSPRLDFMPSCPPAVITTNWRPPGLAR